MIVALGSIAGITGVLSEFDGKVLDPAIVADDLVVVHLSNNPTVPVAQD